MTKLLKKLAVSFLLLFNAVNVSAQNDNIEMANGMYQSGKIYVVVIVMAIIFSGIATYLVILDRKISKLEKENK
jgi:CcmD family protein